MKQTFNLLAEVLALPFSELFFQRDLLAGCIGEARRRTDAKRGMIPELARQIDQMGARTAGHINLHTTFVNTSALQNMVNYVYRAEDIVRLMERCPQLDTPWRAANHYYVMLMKRVAKTFLTVRNGRAAFKYWPGAQEAYPHPERQPSQQERPEWSQDLLGGGFETNRIEAWHSLLQCLPESFLLSCYAVCLAESTGEIQMQEACCRTLLSFGDTVHIADVLLDKVLDQGLAETHLHAGASRSFDLNWEIILRDAAQDRRVVEQSYSPLFQREISQENSQERAREAIIARTLLAVCLRSGKTLPDCLNGLDAPTIGLCSRQSILQTVRELSEMGAAQALLSHAVPKAGPFLHSLGGYYDEGYLLRVLNIPPSMALTDPGFAERCLTAWSMAHIARCPEDVGFTALFLYYMRLKNYFYRCRVQDSKETGLTHFQRFYAQSTDAGSRTSEEKMAGSIYTAIKDRRILKTELRMGPPTSKRVRMADAERDILSKIRHQMEMVIKQHIYAVFLLYRDPGGHYQRPWEVGSFQERWYTALRNIRRGRRGELRRLLAGYGVTAKRVHRHRIGIIYHFIKRGEQAETDSCFLRGGEPGAELERYAAFSFGRTRFQCQAAAGAIAKVRELCPEVSRLIIGLDAASLELPTEPWVFAPAFRLARELDLAPLCRQAQPGGRAEKHMLGLTYHVGEEFRHPLSGLRHISEAVEFYKMHAGDRLGHGLALGIDVDRWFRGHGLITFPRVEWMEDCLWAWEIAAKDPAAAKLSKYTKFLEEQIMSCADAIYETLDGISVEKLAHAYRSKTLGFQDLAGMVRQWSADCRPECLAGMDCLKHPNARFFPCACGDGKSARWWSEDSLVLSYHCRYYKGRMDREILWGPDAQEAALVKELQGYLRRRIAEKGIVLEENPSSNTVIGEINGVLSHPICRLRENSDGAARVITTVNTDDPSVFNANVANEHALVYFALIHQGLSVEDALRTVDGLRRAGLASSFLCEAPPFEQLLDEYERALAFMEKLC